MSKLSADEIIDDIHRRARTYSESDVRQLNYTVGAMSFQIYELVRERDRLQRQIDADLAARNYRQAGLNM